MFFYVLFLAQMKKLVAPPKLVKKTQKKFKPVPEEQMMEDEFAETPPLKRQDAMQFGETSKATALVEVNKENIPPPKSAEVKENYFLPDKNTVCCFLRCRNVMEPCRG